MFFFAHEIIKMKVFIREKQFVKESLSQLLQLLTKTKKHTGKRRAQRAREQKSDSLVNPASRKNEDAFLVKMKISYHSQSPSC